MPYYEIRVYRRLSTGKPTFIVTHGEGAQAVYDLLKQKFTEEDGWTIVVTAFVKGQGYIVTRCDGVIPA